MERSQYLEKANQMIRSVRGNPLTVEERREGAIELAKLLLNESRRIQTKREQTAQEQLARLMDDPKGKTFVSKMTDQCFRSQNASRVADQLNYLIDTYGVPKFLSYWKQMQLRATRWLGGKLPGAVIPLMQWRLRKETADVILPGENKPLTAHMEKRREEGVRVNLNHLGEAILGEEEAESRLEMYLADLARPEVECISVKVSTLCSQINLVAWEETLSILEERLKKLYQTAMEHTYVHQNGKSIPKFVYLDMEEYQDLHLTVDLFRRVLDDPEFFQFSAGIVLQSYLPDSYLTQQELTVWAMRRVASGGAPIKIRIVKGANLAMERVEASLRGWQQAPYLNKADVDSNYKRMLHYGCTPEHASAAKIGIASHNLFDLSYALLLRAELEIEQYVGFEMLEGMVDHIRRVVQDVAGDMLLYCPAATRKEFVYAIAYLTRRLDENTSPENFLRHLFDLIPGTEDWQEQSSHFSYACHVGGGLSMGAQRVQNRFEEIQPVDPNTPFKNEPDTDWALPSNRKWIEAVIKKASVNPVDPIPMVIGGKEMHSAAGPKLGGDPSKGNDAFYQYSAGELSHVELVLNTAKESFQAWSERDDHVQIFASIAHKLRQSRGELIAAMVADTGKTVLEADVEISEAIDFVEYYRRNREELKQIEGVSWKPKGVVLVAPPWNFPCAIPMGGVAAALIAGNSVIFKPSAYSILVAWKLACICWDAGVPREVLQFFPCPREPVGSQLLENVSGVVLTGSTDTAKAMLKKNPALYLVAETGGKNSIIVTELSDRDLAIKNVIHSAFSHAGQKCSACSLLICLPEVYNDPHFKMQLKDAAESLPVGSAWDFASRINPLIRTPNETLHQGLTELDQGEEWLLEPKQDSENPNSWSPGIKWGVQLGTFTQRNELFGPVLGVMCAKNLEEAIEISNSTKYGLTAGIQTLDEREQKVWMDRIEAGNLYINRTITGAIVRRQPFGGCKESSYGPGAKAGGPNYVMQLMDPIEQTPPYEMESPASSVRLLTLHLEKLECALGTWEKSVGSYAYQWKTYFSKEHDPSQILGEKNIFRYLPHLQQTYRVLPSDSPVDIFRVIAAALTCKASLEVSCTEEVFKSVLDGEWISLSKLVTIVTETDEVFIERVQQGGVSRVRLTSPPPFILEQALAEASVNTVHAPVLSNGRVELTRYLREQSLSITTHRYGYLPEA